MDPGDRSEEFVRLLKRHERRLNACVVSLVHNWADAEDVLQEVAVDLWRRFDEYDPSGDFGAWACTVAYYQVLSYRKKKGRQYLHFSAESDRLLSEEVAAVSEETSSYQDMLRRCLDKLSESDRAFLRAYYSGTPIAMLAQQLARTAASLYKDLANLRRGLRACIERRARGGKTMNESLDGGFPLFERVEALILAGERGELALPRWRNSIGWCAKTTGAAALRPIRRGDG